MIGTLTFVILLVVGVLLVLRGKSDIKPGVKTSQASMVIGLVLLGLGGFGILSSWSWLAAWVAALITTIVMVTIPLGVTRSPSGILQGLFAVFIILVLGVFLSLAAGGSWLVEAVAAIAESSTEFGSLVTDWVASWS